jgi:hypothetical protein
MAAAAGTTKRGLEPGEEKRGDPIWEKRRKCNFLEEEEDADSSTAMAAVGSKRGYERGESAYDSNVMFEKRFKCNYWEDPAYAKDLQRWGGRLARMAAQDNDSDRITQEMQSWN